VIERTSASGELTALLAGAATLSRAGNRIAAIATLLSAVQLAPGDLTAHRRLAAAYAVAGDRASAAAEYDRYAHWLDAAARPEAAANERAYAALLLAPPPPVAIAAPAHRALTEDQSFALRRVAVAILAIAMTLGAMFAAGSQIFASGG
jgi:DNA-binding SARP family transcriptional activator